MPSMTKPMCPTDEKAISRFRSFCARQASAAAIDCDDVHDPIAVEVEYTLDAPITGLRVGVYLLTMRGEYVFTSFDTDDPKMFEQYSVRQPGRYVSRAAIPANLLNEGRYLLAVNASALHWYVR